MKYLFVCLASFLICACATQPDRPAGRVEDDILKHAAERAPFHQTVGPERRVPQYGNVKVEKAVETLSSHYEGPWTVPNVIQWYRDAKEPKTRAALLHVLAASCDSRAVPILGPALHDKVLDVRIAATYSLLDYFVKTVRGGGTEQQMEHARGWWTAHRAEYTVAPIE